MSHGTNASKISRANATWYIERRCGPTSSSCQRPIFAAGNLSPMRSRKRAALSLVDAGS